ncbi:DUF3999 family protein [Sulfurimonas sp. MAG313]|nr:DUF3999 family protein [Sulfurimonas sp. MAG313]MDF1879743.1 DUF3999 family protein [Sulfurimonas sp. MAG313]
MKIFIFLIITINVLFALQKDDFAYVKSIITNTERGLIKVKLTPEIYSKLVHNNLSDMAVFDANGHIMPQQLSGISSTQKLSKIQDVPFIKFSVLKKSKEQQLRFEYKGAIINMHDTKEESSHDYIVDLRQIHKEVQTLYLQSNLSKYMIAMDVQCSNDLQGWKTLKAEAIIASLDFQDSRLTQNSIDLPLTSCKYLRLRTQDVFPLTKVEVRTYAKKTKVITEHEPLIFKRVDNSLEFTLSKNINLEKLHFNLEEGEHYYKLSILAKNKGDEDFRLLKHANIYNIQYQGKKLQKHFIQFDSEYDFYKIKAQSSSYLPTQLTLSYEYQRQDLYFLAQGQGPYLLAFGSYEARINSTNLEYLLEGAQSLKEVTLGKTKLLGGEKRLYMKKIERPIQSYLVWMFLVFGVCLLVFISYRLAKQLKQ